MTHRLKDIQGRAQGAALVMMKGSGFSPHYCRQRSEKWGCISVLEHIPLRYRALDCVPGTGEVPLFFYFLRYIVILVALAGLEFTMKPSQSNSASIARVPGLQV